MIDRLIRYFVAPSVNLDAAEAEVERRREAALMAIRRRQDRDAAFVLDHDVITETTGDAQTRQTLSRLAGANK